MMKGRFQLCLKAITNSSYSLVPDDERETPDMIFYFHKMKWSRDHILTTWGFMRINVDYVDIHKPILQLLSLLVHRLEVIKTPINTALYSFIFIGVTKRPVFIKTDNS
jgi:hypothetical protein